ncbi:MAG: ABC transporter substrate-binding protein [Microbacterium sp. SCN 70-27]|uniref:extracellular solute-binding protein n=1 Tax=unclassified Microbacterium TaxID=2609290 RepID=UPI000869FB92|nr:MULTISPECIES: extracellular solute-binding protein [unclassified Microbacterium]MBN9225333.1 extracellular solute-binding protein [Microbacterium sp.]ODT27053.1 MAG: ABC transporter substrate-binding protein [Microbacterium sp. SCN 70-27]
MNKKLGALALLGASAIVLAGCSGGGTPASTDGATAGFDPAAAKDQNITLWLMGGDTPDALRDYLKTEYKAATGGTLTIEEQSWGDALTKLTAQLPDSKNTPDVTEIGNTWSPTFTTAGAFADLSGIYKDLGGSDLLDSFVKVGEVDGKQYALPYYFGSRYITYRKDIWDKAGLSVPKTLDEFNADVAKLKTPEQSGFYIGGQDWRNGISWVFANGGDLAKKDGDKWVSTLSDEKTVEGLEQFQTLFKDASNAPVTENDSTPWVNINNDKSGAAPTAATIIAPGWAHWSIGDFKEEKKKDDGTTTEVREWNDATFGVFPLPGNDGKPAPVFAGGSNIAISAKSTKQAGAKELLRIMFSGEYQDMLGKNGLGPANTKHVDSLGDDIFAKALIDSALNSKLTPAAPGWAAVEGQKILEEFFGKVAAGGDIASLAKEYDTKINAIING